MDGNYYKYIEYYGNSTFNEVKLNEIDFLIFSNLSYLPLSDIKEGILFKDFGEKLKKLDYDSFKPLMTPDALRLMEAVYNTKRYKNIRLYNMVKTVNDEVQFGAMTLRFGNKTIVVYEGTNSSIAGWMENFRTASQFPCLTQKLALDYLNNNIKSSDKNIYLCGHSKGGNLCLSSAYLTNDSIFDRIKKIYNFDGPGFRKTEYITDRFKKVNKKSLNFLPNGSLVGIFLYNKNYRYLDAEGVASTKHFPINWHMYGQYFVHSQLAASSAALKQKCENGLEKITYEELDNALDVLSEYFINNGIIYTYDLQKMKFDKLTSMVSNYRSMDPKSKEIVKGVVKYLLTASSSK